MCAWRKCSLKAWLREANCPVLRGSVMFHSLRHYGLWSTPGSSVQGTSHETPGKNLEWVAISFSRGSSWPRDWTWVSCIGRWNLYHWDTFSLVTQFGLTLCDPMDCSTPGFPIHHQLLELAQTHVHWVGDAIQPSCSLSSPSPPAFSLFQHQGLFQFVSSSHQVTKVLELPLQHQSFQWVFRTYFL